MWADIFTDFERRETLGRAMMMRRRRAAAQKAKSPKFVQKTDAKMAIHRVKWEI